MLSDEETELGEVVSKPQLEPQFTQVLKVV